MTVSEHDVDSDLRVDHWRALSRRSQLSYFQPSPGVPFGNEVLQAMEDTPETLLTPPNTFALMRLKIEKVDFLDLSTEPHTRLAFDKNQHGQWQSEALNP
jgi:hypothetical protein